MTQQIKEEINMDNTPTKYTIETTDLHEMEIMLKGLKMLIALSDLNDYRSALYNSKEYDISYLYNGKLYNSDEFFDLTKNRDYNEDFNYEVVLTVDQVINKIDTILADLSEFIYTHMY